MRCADVENDFDALKPDRRLFRYSKRSLQIQIALDRDIYALCRYAHGSSYHLASDLRAGC